MPKSSGEEPSRSDKRKEIRDFEFIFIAVVRASNEEWCHDNSSNTRVTPIPIKFKNLATQPSVKGSCFRTAVLVTLLTVFVAGASIFYICLRLNMPQIVL